MKSNGAKAAGVELNGSAPAFAPSVPLPPWSLTGSAILFLHGWRSLLMLVHYETSPVGPYNELAVSALRTSGPAVIEMYVTSRAAMIGGRRGWGFPKQMAQFRWHGRGRRVVFEAGRRRWRVRLCGPTVPVKARLCCVQILAGQKVRVPLRVAGRAQLAFQGRRLALLLDPLELTVLPPIFIT